ncbi:MAG: IS5 family transposase [Bacteroidetes bacterium]|nr:IS5 family transposase [Bacteroidota bacterium]
MIAILPKDMIKTSILQHLSQAQRGYICRVELSEVVHAILYKLKTGIQWHLLPVKSLITSGPYSWRAVYHHFRKWCNDGSWRKAWIAILEANKSQLDLSTSQLDGSHSPAKRGGEAVAYQGRKKSKTTNILLLTDRNGLIVACGKPVAGNHNDLYQIEKQVKEILCQLTEANIPIDGLFLNADSGFDSKKLRQALEKEGIMLNAPPNRRNGSRADEDFLLDEEMYKERFAVERTNAWNDSLRTLLIRQDTTLSSWWAWHFIACCFWFLRLKIPKV